MYTFSDWYKTAWDKINVDTLVEETKKLAKEVKTLNKAVSHVCTSHADVHCLDVDPACLLQAPLVAARPVLFSLWVLRLHIGCHLKPAPAVLSTCSLLAHMAATTLNRPSMDGEPWRHHVGVAIVQVRNYEVYRLLEESLKAMLTSLPLVQVRSSRCWASMSSLVVRWGRVVSRGWLGSEPVEQAPVDGTTVVLFHLPTAASSLLLLHPMPSRHAPCSPVQLLCSAGPASPRHARQALEDAHADNGQALCDG